MKNMILDERYELLEHIGSGGMSSVYKARDILLDRLVAVKILNSQLANDKDFIQRFHREAKGAARLSHPNIVAIFDVGEENGNHYIVMEYIAGKTLKEIIKEKSQLKIEEALHIAKKIAAALEMAHKNNLVHCDIKPHNILVTNDGAVKVADFGIARAVSTSTLTYDDTILGSVHYFSPEQAKGTQITPKSDVYSLGIVLFEMLTGQVPFDGTTSVSIALKHIQEEAMLIKNINPNVPEVIEHLVERAMAKDPTLRPDSTELFLAIDSAEKEILIGKPFENSPDQFATQILPRLNSNYEEHILSKDEDEIEDEDEIDSNSRIYTSKKYLLIIVTILLLGFLSGIVLSFGNFFSTPEVDVPNVVGKQMAIAKQLLEESNLNVKLEESFDSTIPIGVVISQDPSPFSKVKEKRQITIFVSKGGEEIKIPQLVGLPKRVAEETIKKNGLQLGNIKEDFSDTVARNLVISQTPKVSSKIKKGEKVDLVISKGKKIIVVKLPDFTGATVDFARTSLKHLRLQIGTITKQTSLYPEGTIINQSYASGSEIPEGTIINFVISQGLDSDDMGNKSPNKNYGHGKTMQ